MENRQRPRLTPASSALTHLLGTVIRYIVGSQVASCLAGCSGGGSSASGGTGAAAQQPAATPTIATTAAQNGAVIVTLSDPPPARRSTTPPTAPRPPKPRRVLRSVPGRFQPHPQSHRCRSARYLNSSVATQTFSPSIPSGTLVWSEEFANSAIRQRSAQLHDLDL